MDELLEMQTPEQQSLILGIVSDEESEDDEPEKRLRRAYQPSHWKSWLFWLTQTGMNGKKLPPVGRCGLILKGEADRDLDWMAVLVSQQTRCMAAVVWRGTSLMEGCKRN